MEENTYFPIIFSLNLLKNELAFQSFSEIEISFHDSIDGKRIMYRTPHCVVLQLLQKKC